MKPSLLVTLVALGLAQGVAARPAPQDDAGKKPAPVVTKRRVAPAQDADAQKGGARQDAQRGKPVEAPKPDDTGRADGARAEQLAALRAAFAEQYFARKTAAARELDAARTAAGRDEAAFAAARTEIARKYRGELATLQAQYADKAKALGVELGLPADEASLERAAAEAAPAAALRADFTAQVTQLARAAQAELAQAEEATAGDGAAFAARRTEIARKYRGQVVALQQAFAEKAAGLGVAVDTSDAAAVLAALAVDRPAPPAPAPAPAKPAPAKPEPAPQQPAPGKPDAGKPDAGKPDAGKPGPDADGATPRPAGRPIDAETLRVAFAKQVESLRTALAAELAAADGSLKGAELAAKRTAIVDRYRAQLGAYRESVAARAQAAGVTVALPTDAELAPELAPAERPAEPPKPADPGAGPKPDAPPVAPPKEGDGATPPKETPPPVGPGGKRGRGPRFGGGGV